MFMLVLDLFVINLKLKHVGNMTKRPISKQRSQESKARQIF